MRLRHEAFGSLDRSRGLAAWPRSIADPFPDVADAPPEVSLEASRLRLLGGGIVHHGCLVVRNLVSSVGVERLGEGIKSSFACRDKHQSGAALAQTAPWYVPFDPGFSPADRFGKRNYVRTVDSPRRRCSRLLGTFDEVGLSAIISDHLGERPALSANKCALRRVPPTREVRTFIRTERSSGEGFASLNVWLALSHCGGDADALGPRVRASPSRAPGRVGAG